MHYQKEDPPPKYPSYNTDLLQKDNHRGVIVLLLSFQQLLETPPYTRPREHTSPRTQYDQRWRNENAATGAGEMDHQIRGAGLNSRHPQGSSQPSIKVILEFRCPLLLYRYASRKNVSRIIHISQVSVQECKTRVSSTFQRVAFSSSFHKQELWWQHKTLCRHIHAGTQDHNLLDSYQQCP